MKKEINLMFGIFSICVGIFMLTINGNYKFIFTLAFMLLGIVFIRHYIEDCKYEKENTNNKETNTVKNIKDKKINSSYKLPNIDILGSKTLADNDDANIRVNIELALDNLGVEAKIDSINVGPVITRVVLACTNDNVDKLVQNKDNLTDKLKYGTLELNKIKHSKNKLELMLVSPNKTKNYLIDCMNEKTNDKLELYIGKEDNGKKHIIDLKEHNSITLTSNNNDSILSLMNSMVVSLIMKHTPNDLELVLIDNSGLNFNDYNSLPHLAYPVNDTKCLNEIIDELGIRLEKLGAAACINIDEYNAKEKDKIKSMVIFINDLDYVIYNKDEEYLENLKIIMDFGKKVGIYLICSVNYTEEGSKDKLLNICDTIIAFNPPKNSDKINVLECCYVCYLKNNVRVTYSIVSQDNIIKVIDFWKNQKSS